MSGVKSWIQSVSGKKVFPAALRPEQVSLLDIPVALSRKMRFSGQTITDGFPGSIRGYSVAQHTVIGSQLIAPPFALAFLLHEVSEVFLPDVPKPIKPMLHVHMPDVDGFRPALLERVTPYGDTWIVPWEVLEEQHADVFMEALGLSSIRALIDSPEVKAMDLQMLALEKLHVMGPEPEPWGLPLPPPARAGKLEPWPEEVARRDWLYRFEELTGTGKFKPFEPDPEVPF